MEASYIEPRAFPRDLFRVAVFESAAARTAYFRSFQRNHKGKGKILGNVWSLVMSLLRSFAHPLIPADLPSVLA